MKRVGVLLLAMWMLVVSTVSVSAQTDFTYVTEFTYNVIRAGGVDGTYVFAAYEGDAYMMGTMTSEGEQMRLAWSGEDWGTLFEPSLWKVTVHSDATALCPYVSSHSETTVCPYADVSLVTLTNTQTGVTVKNYYMQNPVKHILSGGLHMCWGYYGFVSPQTLKWDGQSRYMALKNESGQWGVFDTTTQTMVTAYTYDDMSAVWGQYAKVYNGQQWGRLDLSGTQETVYLYDSEEAFSVTEEIREIAEGQWQVFNEDNEPLSVVYTLPDAQVSYTAASHLLLVTAANGTKTLLDLAGNTVQTFSSTQKAIHLSEACYAIEQYNDREAVVGMALARVDGAPQPDDTVLRGDVNFDAVVDSSDVRELLYHVIDMRPFTRRQLLAAELNEDNIVDSSDVRALLCLILANT